MSLSDWLTAAHILVLGVWLGTDVATFTLSRRVVDPQQPVASRVVLARAMTAVEVFARLCLPLMLVTGLIVAQRLGYVAAGDWLAGLVAVAGAGWLGLVWSIHRSGHQGLAGRLTSVDLALRLVVVGVLWVSSLVGLVGQGGWYGTRWLAAKAALLALVLSSGVAIRVVLRPFGAAFAALVSGAGGAAEDAVLRRCVRRAQPFVVVIWLSLVAATVLAVGKPALGS